MKNTAMALLTVVLAMALQAADAKTVHVKGYTKKDGTVVKGYDREVKDKDAAKNEAAKPAEEAAKTTEVKKEAAAKPAEEAAAKGKDAAGTKVAGYTKKDGTKVAGYNRKAK